MTVNELLEIMGQYHNDGKSSMQVRVFVGDESLEQAANKTGLEIKKIYLDPDTYPKPDICIEV